MASKFLNLSTDNTLGGNSPSENKAVSEKAIKEYVDNNVGQTYTAGTGLQLSDQNEFNILQQDKSGLPYKYISNNITIVGDIYSFPYVGSSGNANTKIELYPPLSITSNDTVEIQFLYRVASEGNRCLLNAYNSTNTTYSRLSLFVGGGNRHNSRTIDFNLNGTSINITPTASQLNNKNYLKNWWYIRIILKPNSQTVDISDDGENWNNIISNTSSAVYNKTFDNIIIGNETVIAQPYAETFYGDIDFSKSFIKINDNIWWDGKGDVAKSVAKATNNLYGLVKPDGTSITINDGVISGNVGTVTSVNNVQPVNGNVTIEIDLSGKADVDLTNVTDTGYIKMAGAGMPSNTYTDLTLGASGTTYTAPANGYYALAKIGNTGERIAIFNRSTMATTLFGTSIFASGNSQNLMVFIPVRKGDEVAINYSAYGSSVFFRFIYAKGSESEAN